MKRITIDSKKKERRKKELSIVEVSQQLNQP
jgi:hypothetical protein